MSSRNAMPNPRSSSEDNLASDQGSTNTAGRYDESANEAVTWNSSEYLEGVTEDAKQANSRASDDVSGLVEQAREKSGEMAGKAQALSHTVQEKAGEIGHATQDKADTGLDAAASGLGQASTMLREQGQQHDGTVGMAAGRAADTLESASSYLRDKDTAQIMDDVEAFVRQRPVESVLIAASIGFVLSKIIT